MILWWGDKPAGYDLEFTGLISGGYEIRIANEWGEMLKSLEADEWVLAFEQP